MRDYLETFDRWWHSNPPVDLVSMATTLEKINNVLPKDYLDFLKWSNGGEGDTGSNHFTFWKIEELQDLNLIYDIESFLPGAVAFGDDGSNIIFLSSDSKVGRTPYGYGADDMVEMLAKDFSEFILNIKKFGP